jgi:hypothetical protein
MALIKISTKGTNLTCDELDNNFDFVLDLANAVGELDCAKINQLSLSTCLLLNQVIIDLQADIDDAETAIGEVAQDLIDVQTTLQGNINSLTTLVNNQNTTIADLNTQIATLIAGFNSLSSTVASFNSRLLSVEGRLTTLEEAIASGIIVVWVGLIANIPVGWQLTDGTNGTPDLRNRFIIGAGSTYAVNAIGGSANHTHTITGTTAGTSLTVNQMPAHNHGFVDPGHIHPQILNAGIPLRGALGGFGGAGDGAEVTSGTGGSNNRSTTSVNTTNINFVSQGANEAHSHGFSASTASTTNLPPYYALAYIMRL